MKKILIIHRSWDPQRIRSLIKKRNIRHWLPLVSSYGKVRDIESVLGDSAERIDIGAKLQKAAQEFRRPFLGTTAEFGQSYNSLAWWTNTISERNTMVNKLFLYCCYLAVAQDCLKQEENLCIVCDSNALIDNIELLANGNGQEVEKKKGAFWRTLRETVFWVICAGLYHLLARLGRWFLCRCNKLYHQIRRGSQTKSQTNIDVILHTWVDNACMGKDGKFKDRYFTVLPEFYRKKGLNVSTFVSLYGIKCSFWSAVSFFHSNEENFIVPEDYYQLADYWLPFKGWLQSRRFKFDSVLLNGIDCSVVFQANSRLEKINFVSMYYSLFKRMAQKGVRPKIVVDGFENMVSDKMIQLGVRDFMPESLVYGFFHTVPSPNVLCFFTDEKERSVAPLPDRIICNGRRFKEIFVREHFPEERIVIGAALRYAYLYKMPKASDVHKGDKFRILLTLSLDMEAGLELFAKVAEAIKGMDHYHLCIKPHPMGMTIIDLIRDQFPLHTEVITSSMADALARSDIVVSGATGAILDCVMADKEVIRVGRENQVDFDPLAWFEEFDQPVLSAEQLRDRLLEKERMMGENAYQRPKFSSLLPELFSPASEENLAPFLPGFLPKGAGASEKGCSSSIKV